MAYKVTIEKAYGKHTQDRWGLMVNIETQNGVFKYMPSWDELVEIIAKLVMVEEMNKQIDRAECKEKKGV